jgi:hypothetical protein
VQSTARRQERHLLPSHFFSQKKWEGNKLISNWGLEVLRRGSHETTEGLPPYLREWAGRVAVGEGPEAGLLGEPTWAGAINRDSGNGQRSKAEAQPGH